MSAQETVAVLSSDSPAYHEAVIGFQESYGRAVPTYMLSQKDARVPPANPKIAVAFGGKAASYPFPGNSTLIYCLAPAFWVKPEQHPGPRFRIYMAPQPKVFLSRLKEIQPGLKRLVIFEASPRPYGVSGYLTDFERAAAAHGIEVHTEYIASVDELPYRLRSLVGHVDALWLAPNPLLITPAAFAVANEFGRSNNVPLYAPIDSLVDKGATASIAASFREMGRTVGRVALKADAGNLEEPENVYPEKYELTLNLTAAAQSGLTISADLIQKADRIVR